MKCAQIIMLFECIFFVILYQQELENEGNVVMWVTLMFQPLTDEVASGYVPLNWILLSVIHLPAMEIL